MNSFPELSETFIRDHILSALNVSESVYVGAKTIKSNTQALEGYHDIISKVKIFEIGTFYELTKFKALLSLINPFNFYDFLLLKFNKKDFKKKILNKRFKKLVENNQIENIHFHFGDVAREFLKVIGPIQNVKIHVTFHGYDIRHLSQYPQFYTPIIQHVDTPIAISTWNFKALLSAGFNSEKIKRINNPIDDKFFSTINVKEKQSLIKILAVGRLEKVKGFDNLLRSVSLLLTLLKEKEVEIQLTIIGEGAERQNLEMLIMELGIQNVVSLTGSKNRFEIKEMYNQSDFLVISSLHEALPTVMLEAMSMGLPIVSTSVGSIPYELPDDNILCSRNEPSEMVQGLEQMIFLKSSWDAIGKSNRQYILKEYGRDVFETILGLLY
ncbi:glycosyltransferase involved in cell wall biosynthesis [Nonlabens xylanidelens]|uniref:Glycosyltransferase involved in cell wall biosynthesis n=2 Tax=Nonlabens xylanidelens TaxID=191564 RepID=A0A2S6ILN7_9FLAO|nr:glycosyltransferase involved in cell wall biosynthesis [Nonlabens xylanidelens]